MAEVPWFGNKRCCKLAGMNREAGFGPGLVNPINLGLRFLLEAACLTGIGRAAWTLMTPPWHWILVIAAPAAAAIAWGVFAVPDDPGRSGHAPVAVYGLVRLAVEATILGAGVAGFAVSGYPAIGTTLAILLIAHYGLSYQRIVWLIRR